MRPLGDRAKNKIMDTRALFFYLTTCFGSMHDDRRAVIEILALWSQNYKTNLTVKAPQTLCLYLVSQSCLYFIWSLLTQTDRPPQTLSHTLVPTHLARCPLWWCQRRRGWAPPPSLLLPRYRPARQDSISPRDTNLPAHLLTSGQGGQTVHHTMMVCLGNFPLTVLTNSTKYSE